MRLLTSDPAWIDAKRVADLVGMDRKTVYLLAERAKIPAYRPRGSRIWRFRSEEIKAWIEEGYNGAPIRKEAA